MSTAYSTIKISEDKSIQSNLAKGSIADLSPLVAVNGFVWSWTPSNTWFLESASKRRLDQFSHFCTAHPCAKHTDTQTTLHATSVAIGRIYALHAGDVA